MFITSARPPNQSHMPLPTPPRTPAAPQSAPGASPPDSRDPSWISTSRRRHAWARAVDTQTQRMDPVRRTGPDKALRQELHMRRLAQQRQRVQQRGTKICCRLRLGGVSFVCFDGEYEG